MTDDQALSQPADTTDRQGVDATDESTSAGIDGRAAWPWIKDAGLLVFVIFFGAVFLVLRSVGLDDATGGGGPGGTSTGPIELSLTEFAISGNLEVTPGSLTVRVINDGSVDHNIVIPNLGLRSPDLKPGEEVTLDLGRVSVRTYPVFCDLTGHRESGMETELVVSSR